MAKYVGYEEDMMYNCTENIGTTESIMKNLKEAKQIIPEYTKTKSNSLQK